MRIADTVIAYTNSLEFLYIYAYRVAQHLLHGELIAEVEKLAVTKMHVKRLSRWERGKAILSPP
jgi:hypothetical protein